MKYRSVLFAVMLCFVVSVPHGLSAAPVVHHAGTEVEARQWDPVDILFRADRVPDRPADVAFTAMLRDADGATIEVPGFYDGGHDYLIRFTPPRVGCWDYVTRSERPELDGLSGAIRAGAARAGRRGGIVIDPASPRSFAYKNGAPYYPIAFEADWLFALDADNSEGIPNTQKLVDTIAENGFNQIIMNVFAYDVTWARDNALKPEHDYGAPTAFPFGGTNAQPDHARLNIDYFKRLDRVIAYLDEQGIAAHLMIYVWNKRVNWPEAESEADNRYFDYVVRRYQAYPNIVWDISKEALGYGRNDMGYITRRIERLRRIDAQQRLVSVHDYGYCKKFPHKIDFMSVQTWSSELYSTMRRFAEDLPGMPVVNIEHGGYEASPYNVFSGSYTVPEVCLERAYQCVFAGTYPTHYWQGAAWNVVIPDIAKLEPADQPRLDYYGHLRTLVDRYHLGGLKAGQKHSSSGFCLTNGDDLYVYYVPKENINLGLKLPQATAGQTLVGTWFDPFTGTFGEPVVKTATQWPSFPKPAGDGFAVLIVEVQPDPEAKASQSELGVVRSSPSPPGPLFESEGGYVVIEAEAATLPSGWVVKNDLPGHTGAGYIQWEDDEQMGLHFAPHEVRGVVRYRFRIETPGVYRVMWRTRQYPTVKARDKDNDMFFRFASGEAMPDLPDVDNFVKAGTQSQDAWTWRSWVLPGEKQSRGVVLRRYDAGVHEIQIAGRSVRYAIDRFVISPTAEREFSSYWPEVDESRDEDAAFLMGLRPSAIERE